MIRAAIISTLLTYAFSSGAQTWGMLHECAKTNILIETITAIYNGAFPLIVRNRADESFRLGNINDEPEEIRTFVQGLLLRGFYSLETIELAKNQNIPARVYCVGQNKWISRELRNANNCKYRPNMLATDEPILGFFLNVEPDSALEIAKTNSFPSIDCLYPLPARPPLEHIRHSFVHAVPGTFFALDLPELANTGSFSKHSAIPGNQLEKYRFHVKEAKKNSGLVILSIREASEILYAVLGKESYARIVNPQFLLPADMLEIAITDAGKAFSSGMSNRKICNPPKLSHDSRPIKHYRLPLQQPCIYSD